MRTIFLFSILILIVNVSSAQIFDFEKKAFVKRINVRDVITPLKELQIDSISKNNDLKYEYFIKDSIKVELRRFKKPIKIASIDSSKFVFFKYNYFDKGISIKNSSLKLGDFAVFYSKFIRLDSVKIRNYNDWRFTGGNFIYYNSSSDEAFKLFGLMDILYVGKSVFNKPVRLFEVFANEISLTENKFFDKVEIIHSNSYSRWDIVFNEFNNDVNIQGCQLPEFVYFLGNQFKENTYKVNLTYNRIDSLNLLSDTSVKCKIYLDPINAGNVIIDSEKFSIAQDSITKYEDMLTIYEKVVNTCRELGMEESVKDFDTQYKIYKIRHNFGILSDFIIWFQEYWWGFGYQRSNILINIVSAFLGSLLIFFIKFKKVFRAYSPNSDHDSETVIKECSDDLFERFKVVFFYTTMVFFSWKLEHARVDYRRYPRTALLIYLIYTIGLIHLAYLAAFVLAK